MKKLFTLILLAAAVQTTSAQSIAALQQQYTNFIINAHTQFGKSDKADFVDGSDNRFFGKDWVKGGVVNNYGSELSKGFEFNYDFMRHELYAKWSDTVIVVDPRTVKYFYLNTPTGTKYFVKNFELDGKGEKFYESLAFEDMATDSAGVKLLKFRSVKRIRANKNDYAANFSGDYSDTFSNSFDYYVVTPDGKYKRVKLSKKDIVNALSAYPKLKNVNVGAIPDQLSEEAAAVFIEKLNHS